MESIIGALGTQEFMRIRLGVGPDHPVSDGSATICCRRCKKSQLAELDQVLDRPAKR